ncbi:MAG: hypothetical protein RBT63_00005, partial [Bdellovibrionales bacterium]|nr:hypothetical protein [Bdellovibrionales bacterium]
MKTRVEKTASIVGLMLGALGIVVGFQNCGVSGFEVISDLEKSSLLAKTSVFGVQGSETQSGNQGSGVNASIPVSNDDRTGAEFSVRYFCSTLGFTDQKRVVDVSEIYAEVTLGDTVVCDEKKTQFRDIVDRKKFKISQVCMAKLE